MSGTDKTTRILISFYRLARGEYINKSLFSIEHNITQRSFDRDVEDIRIFLSEIYTSNELIFNKEHKAYHLTGCHQINVSGVEILALLKMLMGSRAFRKDEISGLISAICSLIPADKQRHISQLILSEMDNYISPNHNKAILKIQWDLGQCILKQQIIDLKYYKANGEQVNRLLSPVSIVFSECYFYLIAFRNDEKYDYPAFFRLDRIDSFKMTNHKYPQTLFEQYSVGNMKNCIQFMYAGELIDVKLKCLKSALESLLDRLPNAKVIEEYDIYVIVTARIFGDGFIHWVLSQGIAVEVLEPIDYRKKVINKIDEMYKMYA